jgi:hypothetical protein
MMRNVVWTAVLAVLFALAGVVTSIVVRDYPELALCLTGTAITLALLSNREGS